MGSYGLILFFAFFIFALGAQAESFCVKKDGVKLRAAPSEHAKVSWRVPKYMPLLGTGKKKNSFIEVKDFENETHWVLRKDVSSKLNCIVVVVPKVRLRSGPGASFDLAKIPEAEKYDSFVDLGGEDGWTQVKNSSGAKAWVDLDKTWKPLQKKMRLSFEAE